jgi:hypothetical protein
MASNQNPIKSALLAAAIGLSLAAWLYTWGWA